MQQIVAKTTTGGTPNVLAISVLFWGGKGCLFVLWLLWPISSVWSQTSDAQVQRGKTLFGTLGCLGCHSVDGTPRIGPSMLHLHGKSVRLLNGSNRLRDDAYFRQQILYPEQVRIAGYPPIMPGYNGRIQEQEILALLAYLRTLAPPSQKTSHPIHSKKVTRIAVVPAVRSVTPLQPQPTNPSALAQVQNKPSQREASTSAYRHPTAKTLALGQHYYRLHCGFCHGVNGRGDGPGGRGHAYGVKNFANGEFLYGRDPEILYNIISHGSQRTNIMPAWKHLPASVRWSLVTYLRNLAASTQKSK